MMDFIIAPLIVGTVTLGIYKLFELFVCKKERLNIIEKLGEKLTTGDITGNLSLNLNYARSRYSFSGLKAGCLMLGIGLGLLIGFFVCVTAFPNYTNGYDYEQPIRHIAGIVYGAGILLFGGLGLLIAFLIEVNISKKKEQD